jgi:NAD(P)-dependent dehydrogenase (short-subunit alcohol dehydrogenase family)
MRALTIVLLATLLALSPISLAQEAPQPVDPEGKAVLVTGASSGIGLYTARLLADNGFYVYAGARKQADMDMLDAMENVEAIRLDVTVQEDIDAAVEHVTNAGRGLHGLINNAGILIVAPMIEVREEDLAWQLDVNVLGVYRVTKAFAPLIIESQGRISTTSSVAGLGQWHFNGPYTISKHAVESLTDALSLELALLGVHVSTVEPGNYNSRLESSMLEQLRNRGYASEDSYFQRYLGRYYQESEGDRSQFKEPDEVAQAFFHAMTSASPKRRYLVVPNESEAGTVLQMLVNKLVEVNSDQPYELSREELIEMLDVALDRVESETETP